MKARKALLLLAAVSPFVMSVPAYAATHPAHWTDGTTHDGNTNYGAPPVAPKWADGQTCHVDLIDPPTFVFVTEHFDYNNDGSEDASVVVPYVRQAPGLVEADVSDVVAGHAGVRWDTWNIGTGATAKVPFDCVPHPTTTTTAPKTTTTVVKIGTPTSMSAPVHVAAGTTPATLPHTGAYSTLLLEVGIAVVVLGASLVALVRERT